MTQTEALSIVDTMKLALVALDIVKLHYTQNRHVNEAITAIKEALAQPEQDIPVMRKISNSKHHELSKAQPAVALEQRSNEHLEPVAVVDANDEGYWADILPDQNVKVGQFLYTAPPQRDSSATPLTWVGLTEEEVEACFHHVDEAGIGLFDFADAIEAKLKEKNT